MISASAIQETVQNRLFANIPASVRQAYDEANINFRRRLSQAVKTAENPSAESPDVAEQRRRKAALVVSAKSITPEKARANIVASYTKQLKEGVDALSSAIERVKGKEVKKDATDSAKPELSKLLLEAAQDDE
jgi:hypothetical protein